MSIQVTFVIEEDEVEITQSTLDIVPRVGEIIWFLPSGVRRACTVKEVCYWISVEHNNNYQTACIYLKELKVKQ